MARRGRAGTALVALRRGGLWDSGAGRDMGEGQARRVTAGGYGTW